MVVKSWSGIVGREFDQSGFYAYTAPMRIVAWRPQFVVLHNTAVPTMAEWHRQPGGARMRGLEHFYRDVQNWSAGPHLFIADDRIWTFTPLWVPGVHSPSWNKVAWGVEVVGDYETEVLLPETYNNLLCALEALHHLGKLDPTTLRLHREDPKTTHQGCPGKNLADRKNDIIAEIQQRLNLGKEIA